MRSLPNLITFLRILLVVPFVWALLHGGSGQALLLFAVAGASDGLDGFLAKRFGWTSRLGAVLDPVADKLLLLAAYLTLGWLGQLPTWLVGLVVLRDVVIVGGAVAYYRLFGEYDMEPLLLSKFNTVCQIGLAVLVLLLTWRHEAGDTLISAGSYLVAVTTLSSGVAYVWVWTRRALGQRRAR